jgi:hypothetical protein
MICLKTFNNQLDKLEETLQQQDADIFLTEFYAMRANLHDFLAHVADYSAHELEMIQNKIKNLENLSSAKQKEQKNQLDALLHQKKQVELYRHVQSGM